MSTKSKLKLSIQTINTPGFQQALGKLGEENIPTADRYALARTMKTVSSHLKTFRDEHFKLIKRVGEPELAVARRKLARAQEEKNTNPDYIKHIQERITALEARPGSEDFAVDDQNEASMKAFNDGIKELLAVEFEVYLDHTVVLPEFTKLSSADIHLLLDLVEPPVAPAATEPAKTDK